MRIPAERPPERPAQGLYLQAAMIAVTVATAVVIVMVTGSTAGLADLGTLLAALAILTTQGRRP